MAMLEEGGGSEKAFTGTGNGEQKLETGSSRINIV